MTFMPKNTSLKRYFISSFTPKRIMLKLITNQLNAMNIKSVMPTFMLLLLIMGSGMMMILITPFDVLDAGAQGQDGPGTGGLDGRRHGGPR